MIMMPSMGFCGICNKDLQCWHADYGEVDGSVSIYCNECIEKYGGWDKCERYEPPNE